MVRESPLLIGGQFEECLVPAQGLPVRSLVDAGINEDPSSIKRRDRARKPDDHQARRGPHSTESVDIGKVRTSSKLSSAFAPSETLIKSIPGFDQPGDPSPEPETL